MLQNLHGLMVDNIVSLRTITASGEILTCSETVNPDLFWAHRGAGKHFGVVTELELKMYPLSDLQGEKEGEVWVVLMMFHPGQVEAVMKVVAEMEVTERMVAGINYACPPPAFEVGLFSSLTAATTASLFSTLLLLPILTSPFTFQNRPSQN